ncbi:MAG: hypothetical protein HQ568_02635, partial [Calditrichaeota bacterium]|nr:hypothetical protein [Calditrichota bacterium]
MLKNILIILLILSLTAHADIINVPEDIETIQEAIHESEDGDTVLVQPGEYVENINFEGKAITVTSLILTTGNEAYIDSTIIDGNERDCVVSFEDQEDTTSILQGFTIRNGQQSYGGGIDCQGTSPMLIDLHITGNIAGNLGGGVYCNLEGSPQIRRVIIEENEAINGGGLCANVSNVSLRDVIIRRNIAGFGGGGIYLMEGSITLDYVVIFENQAGEGNGGGIENIYTEELILRNVTITRNSAEHGGGIAHGTEAGLNATLINCIVFNNSNEEIIIGGWDSDNPNIINIAYSDIEGGEDGIAIEEDFGEVEWGDGNIDEDPLFVDPDENDYYLTNDSPCINTGDPDSPEDPDGSRADMGALPYTHTGIIEGFVLDLIEDDPLVDAIVSDQFGSTTRTDDEGFFRLFSVTTQVFDLTASHSGYNDLTLYDQQVDDGDTLEVVFRLTHPTIQLSEERIDATLDQGDSTEVELTITNQGNGQLEWQAKKRLAGEAGADPWELRRSYSVSDTVHDARIEGVVFAENAFYVSGSNIQDDDNETMIYVLDRDGREINRFPQFGEARYGMRDLAWDGELIWGCSGNMVFGFTIEGDSITSFEGPEYDLSAITWDPDREVLWVARKTGRRIYAMKTDGSEVDSLQLPRYGLRVYGLAYWPDAPDDSRLYVFHNPDNYSEIVHKINP